MNQLTAKTTTLSLIVALLGYLTGCQAISNWQPNAGPSKKTVETALVAPDSGVTVIDIDPRVITQLNTLTPALRFADVYRQAAPFSNIIRAGDVVDVTIYEAPPALLFGSTSEINAINGSKEVKLPEQMVDGRGQITVPFVGKLVVAGKTPQQVQEMIVAALNRKANRPSAIVRIAKNNSADVTVIGEVNDSKRVALTGKGERVLDAIAAAGGAKQPASRVTIQLNRGGQSVEMAYDAVVNDPRQNVVLQAGDVVSVNYQSKSFTALGATIKNDEINFETNGISLMQALARAGGLNDNRADARGVFIFRYDNARVLTPEQYQALPTTLRGAPVVPVVYRLDLKDPVNYLLAQNFMVKDKDVVYVSNAPGTEFGKFVGMVSQGIFAIAGIDNLSR